jgi:hypothetical protein
MANIHIIGEQTAPKSFVLDLAKDAAEIDTIKTKFAEIVTKSFIDDSATMGEMFARKILTVDETRRRSRILRNWYMVMRGDLGWGLVKTLDHLPDALRTELNGGRYEPPAHDRPWSPKEES